VSNKYIQAWEATKPTEVDMREKLFTAYKMVKYVKLHIVTYAQDGELEQKNIVSDIKRR